MKGLIINHEMNCENIHKMFPNCDEIKYTLFTKEISQRYDYFILSGGEINISGSNDLIYEKEFIKTTTKPIFGICLGMQIICICYNEILKDMGIRILDEKDIIFNNQILNIKYNHGWFIENIPLEFTGYKENNIVHWIQKDNIIAFQGHPEISKSREEIKQIFIDLL